MTLRIALLFFAASALTLNGCAQKEWEKVTPSSRSPHPKTSKKHTKDPPEEDDSDEPKYDLLR
jgi:hypothetical protein